MVINLAGEADMAEAVQAARDWIKTRVAGGVLNVAGPRASKDPAVYGRARQFVMALLRGERSQAG